MALAAGGGVSVAAPAGTAVGVSVAVGVAVDVPVDVGVDVLTACPIARTATPPLGVLFAKVLSVKVRAAHCKFAFPVPIAWNCAVVTVPLTDVCALGAVEEYSYAIVPDCRILLQHVADNRRTGEVPGRIFVSAAPELASMTEGTKAL